MPRPTNLSLLRSYSGLISSTSSSTFFFILSSFVSCKLSRLDYSNSSRPIREGYMNQSSLGGFANRQVTSFRNRMIGVFIVGPQRIVKHGDSLLKCDAVLSDI